MSERETRQGLLYVEIDCPSELEAEFHAWYNLEHLPERAAMAGFLRSQRFTALVGSPRWVASYEMDSVAVLESDEYLSRVGAHTSPWTRRITSQVQVRRGVYELEWGTPYRRDSDIGTRGLLAVRFEPAAGCEDQVVAWHDNQLAPRVLQIPGVVAARRYRCLDPGSDHLALYELSDPWVTQNSEFTREWGDGWESARANLAIIKQALYVRILPTE